MIALFIIGAIVLLITILMLCSIRVELKFYGAELDYKIKYLWFILYPAKEKKPKRRKISKKKDKAKAPSEDVPTESTDVVTDAENIADDVGEEAADLAKDEAKGEKKKLADTIAMFKCRIEQFKIIWRFSEKPLKKLFAHIRIENLIVDFTVSGEDAFDAAMNYGKINAVAYNVLSLIRVWFPISVKSFDINCDFNSKKSNYDGECSINLGLGTLIAVLLAIGVGLLKSKNELSEAGNADANSDINTVKA